MISEKYQKEALCESLRTYWLAWFFYTIFVFIVSAIGFLLFLGYNDLYWVYLLISLIISMIVSFSILELQSRINYEFSLMYRNQFGIYGFSEETSWEKMVSYLFKYGMRPTEKERSQFFKKRIKFFENELKIPANEHKFDAISKEIASLKEFHK